MTEKVNADEIQIQIGGETFRSGTSRGRRLVAEAASGDDEDQYWIDVAERLISKYRTDGGIKHRNDDEGDRLTLAELLDRNDLTVEDLQREHGLKEIDPTDFSVGDIVERSTIHNGDPTESRYGVIYEVRDGDIGDPKAKLVYAGGSYDYLKNDSSGVLRVGRSAMGVGYAALHDISIVDSEEVDDELTSMREEALESQALDKAASKLEVEVEDTWSSSGAVEADRASDQHARLTVSGDALEEPVTVNCKNVFDFGWVANVDADLDEEDEALVIRAARNNSPISTGVRL